MLSDAGEATGVTGVWRGSGAAAWWASVSLASAAWLACLAPLAGAAEQEPRAAAVGTVGRDLFPGPKSPVDTGPAPPGAGRTPRECGACHSDVAAEWAQSEHASAYSDQFFQRAFVKEPEKGCRYCHAPEAAAAKPDPKDLAVGVGCASCHVRHGTVLAGASAAAESPPRPAPHPVERSAALQSASYCGACHQFGFLALPRGKPGRFESPNLQQTTHEEWATSSFGQQGLTCQRCHMPAVQRAGGRPGRDHRFWGRHAEMIEGAVTVAVQVKKAVGKKLVFQADLTAAGVGHAVPTGDLFRRVDWLLYAPGGKLAAIGRLGRTWRAIALRDPVHGMALGKILATDLRIPQSGQGSRHLEVAVPAAKGTWTWKLQHVRAVGPPAKRLVACRPGETCAVMASGVLVVE